MWLQTPMDRGLPMGRMTKWLGSPQFVFLRGGREALLLQVVLAAETGGHAFWVSGVSVRMMRGNISQSKLVIDMGMPNSFFSTLKSQGESLRSS